jgi:hypothetical protein
MDGGKRTTGMGKVQDKNTKEKRAKAISTKLFPPSTFGPQNVHAEFTEKEDE